MGAKIIVDPHLERFMPDYIKNRELDWQKMGVCLDSGDFASIEVMGHKIKGHAAIYGLAPLGEICSRIEQASKDKNSEKIRELLVEYKTYFDSVEL